MDEDDFYDEDISPPPEELEGQNTWQKIQNHPHFRKIVLGIGISVVVLLCILGLIFLIAFSLIGDETSKTNNEESSGYYNITVDYSSNIDSYSYSSYSSYEEPSCSSYYGNEEIGWSYGVMVDLGSSGSRVSIFEWKENEPVQPAPQKGSPYWYAAINPGVSGYIVPDTAASSLIPLLNFAEEKLDCVNANLSSTPIFLFATAGLRLLPAVESEAILNSIRSLVKEEYYFMFEDNWARILTGNEEAIYDWLSVQQIRLLNSDSSKKENIKLFNRMKEVFKEDTAGVIDMGGGSVEVTFDPNSNLGNNPDLSTIDNVEFNNEDYDVYGYSYLYYGHNEARNNVQQMIIDEASQISNNYEVAYPCDLVGVNSTIISTETGQAWLLYGTGNYSQCSEYVRLLFNKTCSTEYEPCAFNDIYQPPTSNLSFIALDGLSRVISFYELEDIPQLIEIMNATNTFCGTPYNEAITEYGNNPVDSLTLEAYCFEGTYSYEFLTTGLNFDNISQQILFVGEYYGVEVSWTLGAMLDQVNDYEF